MGGLSVGIVSRGVVDLENVAGLTLQYGADALESRKTYGLCLAGLQNGEIGNGNAHAFRQLAESDAALAQYTVEIDYY